MRSRRRSAHAVRHDLAVSVRSGGHSPLGHSTNTGGMVIDLAHLDAVEVLDADRRLVRVGGGATWGKVSAALDPHGWALTAGDTADVGVGGLTLGGGIGWMVRRYGLAIDNLVGARVVTADGRLVTASADEHADLFWALRGGGGNFGVVVDFDFVAQQVSTVHYGTITYQARRSGRPAPAVAERDAARAGGAVQHPGADAPDARCPADGERAAVLRRRTGHRGDRRRRGHRADAGARHGDPGQHRRAQVRRDPGGGAASRRVSGWSDATPWCRPSGTA